MDTSVEIAWLKNKGYDVIACCIDVGEGKDLEEVKQKGLAVGAVESIVIDAKKNSPKNIVCRRSKVTHIMKTSIRSFPLFHVRSSSSTWSKLPKNTVQLRLLTDAPAKATIRFVLKSAFTL